MTQQQAVLSFDRTLVGPSCPLEFVFRGKMSSTRIDRGTGVSSSDHDPGSLKQN